MDVKGKMMERYVDPYTKHPLNKDGKGNLYYQQGEKYIEYVSYKGSYDFVRANLEREYYNSVYKDLALKKLTFKDVYKQWLDDKYPQYLIMLNSLGNLSNKRMLILGNGTSSKEFYFLKVGAKIIYTDLAIEAVNFMKDKLFSSELKEMGHENIEFHAVDALHLPFPDASFDVIYGNAMVHHINDLNQFFSEVNRCLKKDGICRFIDDAYSPIWEFTKNTLLKPLQLYIHNKRGISPEDLRATQRGGYRREELIELMHKFGFTKLVFIRVSFFQHLFRRGIGKLLGYDHYLIRNNTPIMKVTKWLDDNFAKKNNLMQKNLIKLVWGFNK